MPWHNPHRTPCHRLGFLVVVSPEGDGIKGSGSLAPHSRPPLSPTCKQRSRLSQVPSALLGSASQPQPRLSLWL